MRAPCALWYRAGVPPAYGPRDELSGPGLPPAWRALLVPSLLHGAGAGVALGLALLPIAIVLEATRGGPFRVAACVATVVVGLLVGLLGASPAAALEARARGRSTHPLLVSALCGGLVSLAGVVLFAQAAYLRGVVFGGIEGGMHRLADMVSAIAANAGVAVGSIAGVLLALATPFALVTAGRLSGRSVRAQAFLTVAAHLVLVIGLVVLLGILGAILGGAGGKKIDLRYVHPVAAGAVMLVGLSLAGLLVPGLPLAFFLPPALRLADRLGERSAPPEAPP